MVKRQTVSCVVSVCAHMTLQFKYSSSWLEGIYRRPRVCVTVCVCFRMTLCECMVGFLITLCECMVVMGD